MKDQKSFQEIEGNCGWQELKETLLQRKNSKKLHAEGRPSKFYETCDPDLTLSINLGYSPHNGNTPGIESFSRRKRSRKFQMHQQQAEID